ncbi:hypothetical protein CKAN_00536800 [Cinnamomum micranthum f. kanehirae]|uniref:PWWP domain-containing protein n=1 Tax=Cinnamomum micranthum f. kanehirae TaxID=337451 RepID=A0A443NEE7_9MAGN|nr:hypothetical protein CKAN_00536800 [Cinnamomum micranthum f. kanehirae]
MASINTVLDLNHDACDQTLTLDEPQNPIDIEEKQVGNQDSGVSMDRQGELAPNQQDPALPESESAKGFEIEDNSRIGEEASKVFQDLKDGDSVDKKRDVRNLDGGGVPSDNNSPRAGAGGGAEIHSFPADDKGQIAGIHAGEVVGASVVGGSPKKKGLATVNEGSVVGVSALKAWDECGVTDAEKGEHGSQQEEKGGFSVYDMIWGKIKGHPSWPGQILDPSDSSELASKYRKKDRLLVAYFGDQSFAWCEESQLKSFQTHFSEMERQSASESFLNAVNCASDEVSRRVELGLICSCVPEELCSKIKYQKIENAGIREGATGTSRSRVDMSLFEPARLLEYVKELALLPSGGVERLELVIARAQLMSFYRSKGYWVMPAFHVHGGLVDNAADSSLGSKPLCLDSGEKVKSQGKTSHRHKQILEDALHHKRKRKSLAEIISGKKASAGGKIRAKTDGKATGNLDSLSSRKKFKAVNIVSDDSVQTRGRAKGHVDSRTPTEKRSTIGERMQRVADQLTGSPPILEFSGGEFQNDSIKVESRREKDVHLSGSLLTPRETWKRKAATPKVYSSSPDELLSQLCLAARDPLRGYKSLAGMISFFTDFRISLHQKQPISAKKSGSSKTGKGKSSKSETGPVESFDLNDTDSNWTDLITRGISKKALKSRSVILKEYSSLDVLLSQLCLVARDPRKGYSFMSVLVSFFTEFRKSFLEKHSNSGKKIGSGKSGRGKLSNSKTGFVKLNDMKEERTEEEPSQKSRKRKGESQLESPKKQGKDDTGQNKDVSEGPDQMETEE